MQKNETYLLDAWIRYYAYLFGIENLYILDNGSTKQETKNILSKYDKMGCNIIYQYNTHDDFENKGEIICQIIQKWDETIQYDFSIPIDIDEFIILHKTYPTCNKEKIHDYFKSLIGIQDAFIMREAYLNIPGEVGFFSPTYVPKSFFASKTIQSLDHGFHHPVSKYSSTYKDTQFAYLHFHNRPFYEIIEHAKMKLAAHVDINDREALKQHQGPGEHLTKYFFMTEDEYYQLYRGNGHIYFYELLQLFLSLSIDLEATFNAKYIEIKTKNNSNILIRYPSQKKSQHYSFGYFNRYQYILMNDDVQESGIDPVLHFCLHGFLESHRIINISKSELLIQSNNFIEYLSDPNNLKAFNMKLARLI